MTTPFPNERAARCAFPMRAAGTPAGRGRLARGYDSRPRRFQRDEGQTVKTMQRLNLRQQRLVDLVVSRARKEPGLHVHRDRQGMSYAASRNTRGTISWRVLDFHRHELAAGECA